MDAPNPVFEAFWRARQEQCAQEAAPRGGRPNGAGGRGYRPRRFRGRAPWKKSGRRGGPMMRAGGRGRRDKPRQGGRRHRRRRQEKREREGGLDSGRNNQEPSGLGGASIGSGWWQRSTSHPVCPPAPLHEPQYLKDTAGNWRYDRPSPSANGGVGSACREEGSCEASGLSFHRGDRPRRTNPAPLLGDPGRSNQPNAGPGGKRDSMANLFGPSPWRLDRLVETARGSRGPGGIPPIAMEIINNLQMENEDLQLRVRQLEAHVGRPGERDTSCSQMDEHLPDAVPDDASQIGRGGQS